MTRSRRAHGEMIRSRLKIVTDQLTDTSELAGAKNTRGDLHRRRWRQVVLVATKLRIHFVINYSRPILLNDSQNYIN